MSAGGAMSPGGATSPGGGLTAVAMSGGLDSSVAAHLLAARGEPVVGLSMLLWEGVGEPAAASGSGRCCGALDLGDARRVAEQIGIPHYTLRMDEDFRRHVVDPFVDDYLAGRTPSPCVRCNTWVKFDLLLERARRFGAERVATGHYARLVDGPAGRELHAARVPGKDQSYFLFELDQQQLAAAEFPLGELSKEEVRDLARAAGLLVAEKGESMDLCFSGGDIRTFLSAELERRGAGAPDIPSTIVDEEGRVLGEGQPYFRYTIGQRRGVRVSGRGDLAGQRLYVLSVKPAQNTVVVGASESSSRNGMIGANVNWINPDLDLPKVTDEGLAAIVRIRSRHSGVAARVRPIDRSKVEILFEEPQIAITPGQAAVFYDGTRVIGGCWIENGFPSSVCSP